MVVDLVTDRLSEESIKAARRLMCTNKSVVMRRIQESFEGHGTAVENCGLTEAL